MGQNLWIFDSRFAICEIQAVVFVFKMCLFVCRVVQVRRREPKNNRQNQRSGKKCGVKRRPWETWCCSLIAALCCCCHHLLLLLLLKTVDFDVSCATVWRNTNKSAAIHFCATKKKPNFSEFFQIRILCCCLLFLIFSLIIRVEKTFDDNGSLFCDVVRVDRLGVDDDDRPIGVWTWRSSAQQQNETTAHHFRGNVQQESSHIR